MALSLAGETGHVTEELVTRRAAAQRRMVEAGHGAWFGAFLGGRLEASLALFAAGPGLARSGRDNVMRIVRHSPQNV